jgi:hypothetical protein
MNSYRERASNPNEREMPSVEGINKPAGKGGLPTESANHTGTSFLPYRDKVRRAIMGT